jgi:membrane-bound metal-dependent hydrolase YbcI (DUF457 family)
VAWKTAREKHAPGSGQADGDERRPAGDDPKLGGASGDARGLSGAARETLLFAWLIALAIITLVMVFNVQTRAHNMPEHGWLWPLVDEISSALVTAVVSLLPLGLALWTVSRRPPLWQAAPAWVVGAALYPVLHVSGFVLLRALAYGPVLGRSYVFDPFPGEFVYEASKDVPAFALGGLIAWLIFRWRLREPDTVTPPMARGGVLDIRDGARLVRTPLAEVLAARSAGNYVEFLLSDGRRPLMRTSLAAQAEQLAAHGFVRTHRSWLVNTARVTGLRPDGSGDYTVELGPESAPLSRRFRTALDAIRG